MLAIVEFCVEHKSSTKALISFSKHAFVLFSQPRFRLHSFFFKDKPAKKNKGRGAFKILSDKKYYIYKERRAIHRRFIFGSHFLALKSKTRADQI